MQLKRGSDPLQHLEGRVLAAAPSTWDTLSLVRPLTPFTPPTNLFCGLLKRLVLDLLFMPFARLYASLNTQHQSAEGKLASGLNLTHLHHIHLHYVLTSDKQ